MSLEVLNPATELPIATLEPAGRKETDRAVAAAKAAFPAWRAVNPADRARLLRRPAGIANDTPCGPSGSVWTASGARALRVARAIKTGGFKQSGFGRKLGMAGMAAYSETKNVVISTEG